jgi:hypothetical protein
MNPVRTIRHLVAASLALLPLQIHAQTLPSLAPTSQAAPAGPARPSQQPATHARIALDGRTMTITAENASLNQILREIAERTGMKITGGVTDERVFGTYGPADVSSILTTLLDGTGSNMLLLEDAHDAPQTLVLTPRNGGPTPPSPNSDSYRSRSDREVTPRRRPFEPTTQPQPSIAVAPPQSPTTPPAANANPPAAGTTTQQSPNGVKTPEQIYQQLLQMQQQQPKPPQ